MRKVGYIFPALVIFAAVLSSLFPTYAQDQGSSSNIQVTTVVTALGPKYTAPPALGKEDINVTEGKQKREVTNWVPAQGDRAGTGTGTERIDHALCVCSFGVGWRKSLVDDRYLIGMDGEAAREAVMACGA